MKREDWHSVTLVCCTSYVLYQNGQKVSLRGKSSRSSKVFLIVAVGKLEREQKMENGEGGGGWREQLLTNPTILFPPTLPTPTPILLFFALSLTKCAKINGEMLATHATKGLQTHIFLTLQQPAATCIFLWENFLFHA